MKMITHSLPRFLVIVLCASAWTARAEVAETAAKVRPLTQGKAVPEVTLKTADKKEFALKIEAAKKPAVIIFYRGGWCPYCNKHLSELQEAESKLLELGYQIVAISPDAPEALQKTSDKQKLNYTLLSDTEMKATEAFGLAFKVDDATVEKYKGYKINLPQKIGQPWLPVPAVYLVGTDGKISFAHWDSDIKTRLSVPELLKAAKEFAPKK